MAGIQLTSEDVARLAAAQQALLSPLQHDDATDWQLRANRAVRHLLGADHSVFSLPAEDRPGLVSDDTDPQFAERFRSYCLGIEAGEYRFRDPYFENASRIRRRSGTGAYHERELGGPDAIARSTGYQEVFAAAGLTNMIGLSTPLPIGEATQFFAFEGAAAEERSERGALLIDLLVGAFEAGVRLQRQLIDRRAVCIATLDRTGVASTLFAASGTLLHSTAAMERLLHSDGESQRLRDEVQALACALLDRWSGPERPVPAFAPEESRRSVLTSEAGYRLTGGYLDAELLGSDGVLITVERVQPFLPGLPELCSRFDLTRREAEVALLLAEGITDCGLATRLQISRHTARRYSERVLGKLGVHSRAAVALTLMRSGGIR